MDHLAARPRYPLAEEVDGCPWTLEPLLIGIDLVPDQIGHGDLAMPQRLAERPAGDCPYMLLELRDRGAVQRPVAGIVHPRSDLVDQDFRPAVALQHEH